MDGDSCPGRRWRTAPSGNEGQALGQILKFPVKGPPVQREEIPAAPKEKAEVVVFPRTSIRELRRLWGLPEVPVSTSLQNVSF
jgi:hypothetical protein